MAFEFSVRMGSCNPGRAPKTTVTPTVVSQYVGCKNVVATPLPSIAKTLPSQPTLASTPQIIGRPMTVRRLANPPIQHIPSSQCHVISKLYLKAVAKSNKKDLKTFVLRNICDDMSVSGVKYVIRDQQKHDAICGDFNLGVMQGTAVVNVCTPEDLKDMWMDLRKGDNQVDGPTNHRYTDLHSKYAVELCLYLAEIDTRMFQD